MKKYTLLEHTTDIRLKLEASTLNELFSVALEGMSALMKHQMPPGKEVMQEISVRSPDLVALLIDFLSEVVTLSNIKKTVYTKVAFTVLTQNELCAKLVGVPVDSFDEDIKAVTYHEAFIHHEPNGMYEALVLFDI